MLIKYHLYSPTMIIIAFFEVMFNEQFYFFYTFYLDHSSESTSKVYKPSFQIHPKLTSVGFLLVKPDWIWNESF